MNAIILTLPTGPAMIVAPSGDRNGRRNSQRGAECRGGRWYGYDVTSRGR
jgi:hypothetical protein